jgi:protein gp37
MRSAKGSTLSCRAGPRRGSVAHIVGGESRPYAPPLDAAWVTEIRDQCQIEGVPIFFKQWGGTNKKKAGRMQEGRTWNEQPDPPAP